MTVCLLTRKASYEGGGLWQEVCRNFCVFTSSELVVDQQQRLVAWDRHLDFVTPTVTEGSRSAGNDDITYRYQNELRTTQRRSKFSHQASTTCTGGAAIHSRLSTHLLGDYSRPEWWREGLCPGEREQTALRWQKLDAGSTGRSGSAFLEPGGNKEEGEQQVMNFIHKHRWGKGWQSACREKRNLTQSSKQI